MNLRRMDTVAALLRSRQRERPGALYEIPGIAPGDIVTRQSSDDQPQNRIERVLEEGEENPGKTVW